MARYDLDHARHDRAHVLAPGLFRSLKKGERKREKLDIRYEFNKKEAIEFSGPEPLGTDDLRVLQGLVAMAGPRGVLLPPEPETEKGQQLGLGLFTDEFVEKARQDPLVVQGSMRDLLREMGYEQIESGDAYKHLRRCIERLFKVSVIVEQGRKRVGSRLLSAYAADDSDGTLAIALNPRLTEAILGKRPYARINMEEVRALHGDAARLIHQRLSGWIDPGEVHDVRIETLIGYVWPSSDGGYHPASESTERKRRERISNALVDLQKAGWSVVYLKRRVVRVGRPAAPDPPQ